RALSLLYPLWGTHIRLLQKIPGELRSLRTGNGWVAKKLVFTFLFSWIRNIQANDEADAYAVTNNVVELRDNYPWDDLKGTVVDIGGGSGHVSIELAK
ncbi:MAG: hypothetical protein Q9180_009958, partial [Flavoplaca navasiana]